MAEADSMPGAQKPKAGGVVVPHRLPWAKRLLAWLVYALIRVVSASLRYHFQDSSGLFEKNPPEPVIYCIWHNRLALSLMVFLKHPRKLQPSRRLAAVVSASRDGALLARVLELFGVQPVRGSTSRRGPQALLELTTWAERGYDLAITPDGPRGPCYVVQDGVIALAQLTGQPIVPVCYHLNWKIRPGSWDRFQIPLPFARVTATFSEPIRVPRKVSKDEREEWRKRVEDHMRSVTFD